MFLLLKYFMKRKFNLTNNLFSNTIIISLIITVLIGCSLENIENNNSHKDFKLEKGSGLDLKNLKIQIMYDNNQYLKELETAWGFSCFIKSTEQNILFDTGGDGNILLRNMEKIEIDPSEIDIIFLSHIHNDHVGGLQDILNKNSNVVVILPKSFPESFKEAIINRGVDIIEVHKPQSINSNCFSTGELGTWIKEQSLIINTDNGIIIITGCAHPGIAEIVKHSKNQLKEDVLMVMGGFHISGTSEKEIVDLISNFKTMGVKYATPCHCSGDDARKLFSQKYGSKYINIGVGKEIAFVDLK